MTEIHAAWAQISEEVTEIITRKTGMVPRRVREDIRQEALGLAWQRFRHDCQRGAEPWCFPILLALRSARAAIRGDTLAPYQIAQKGSLYRDWCKRRACKIAVPLPLALADVAGRMASRHDNPADLATVQIDLDTYDAGAPQELSQTLRLRMLGCTVPETAERMRVSQPTVSYRLRCLREHWLAYASQTGQEVASQDAPAR